MALDDIPVWTIPPDWSGGITETLEWLTSVMASPKGSEQRMALRTTPRRSFEMTMKPVGPIRTLFDMFLLRSGAQPIYAPVWHEIGKLTVAAAIGNTTIYLDTLYTEFAYADAVLIQGRTPFNYEIAEISAVTDTWIVLAAPLTALAWPIGTRVYPLKRCRIEVSPQAARRADRAVETRVKFSTIDANPYPASNASNCCVLDDPNDGVDLTYSYQSFVAELDNQTGKRYQASTNASDLSATRQQYSWWAKGRQRNAELRGLFYLLKGRQVPIWAPTYFADFDLVENIVDTGVVVKRCGYTDMGGPATGRRFILFHLHNGCGAVRKIVSSTIVGDGTTERLVMEETIDHVVTPAEIKRISFVSLCRLDQDSVEITHHTDSKGLSTASAMFRSLNAEEQ